MGILTELNHRNSRFAERFSLGDLPPLPQLGTLILTCIDARVDPAHVLGIELGDAVVFRNNGGRATLAFIDEVAALAALVTRLTGAPEAGFTIILMQHTKCGARNFADPAFRAELENRIGVDVSQSAITNPQDDLITDIARLRDAPHLPDGLRVAAMLYDVETGRVAEIAPERTLADLRARENGGRTDG